MGECVRVGGWVGMCVRGVGREWGGVRAERARWGGGGGRREVRSVGTDRSICVGVTGRARARLSHHTVRRGTGMSVIVKT